MTGTKMLCTIGPATDDPKILTRLVAAGMDCARMNFSHGQHADHARRFKKLQQEARKQNKTIATLLDLTGPKLRVGTFKDGAIDLIEKEKVKLTVKPITGRPGLIPVNYSKLAKEVKTGDNVLLDDGLIQLSVLAHDEETITCRVIVGGQLKNRKGINLPGVAISQPALTKKDFRDLSFGLQLGVDYVALSFVRSPQEVIQLKKEIARQGYRVPVVAKIEKPEAIPLLEEIIQSADGIMIARGDLGVEMNPEQVPILQKKMIALANRHGRFVITATQMLQSMMDNPSPTRAEASDVANAIFDGTDAVMLSGETAAGHYPVQAALMMKRIITSAETTRDYYRLNSVVELNTTEDHVVASAVTLAEKVAARALVVYTKSGHTAKLVSRQRPEVPIVVLAHSRRVVRELSLWWGMDCLLISHRPAVESIVAATDLVLRKYKKVKKNDSVVILASAPKETVVNLIKVHIIQ